MAIPRIKIPSWARYLFSAAAMAFIFTMVDFDAFLGAIANANPWWLVVGLTIVFIETVVVALAWRAMLRTKGFSPPLTTMLHIMLVSNFLGFILPSSMGPDVMKVLGLSKYIGNAAEALSSLFLFRVIGYGVLFFIALVTISVFPDRLPDEPFIHTIWIVLLAGFAAGAVGIAFMEHLLGFAKRLLLAVNANTLFGKLKKLHGAFVSYLHHPGAISKAFGGALFTQVDRIVYVYVIALALGLEVDIVTLCVFIPLITAITTIPISISGIGVREGGYIFLFGYAGLNSGQALGLSLCGFALGIAFVLLGGVIYVVLGFPENEGLDDQEKLKKLMAEDS